MRPRWLDSFPLARRGSRRGNQCSRPLRGANPLGPAMVFLGRLKTVISSAPHHAPRGGTRAVKGAGLRSLWRRPSGVQISSPALRYHPVKVLVIGSGGLYIAASSAARSAVRILELAEQLRPPFWRKVEESLRTEKAHFHYEFRYPRTTHREVRFWATVGTLSMGRDREGPGVSLGHGRIPVARILQYGRSQIGGDILDTEGAGAPHIPHPVREHHQLQETLRHTHHPSLSGEEGPNTARDASHR